ncbi:MAG: AMP-binding protein [Treponema sp.]|nr:AMP-binding protein [Treponema sp.]
MGAFGYTLIAPPSMAFRFALFADRLQKDPLKRIRGSPGAKRVEAYCYKVSALWCVFFILNGSAALYTIFWASESAWALYNGGVSYIFMGTLFVVEWIVRKMVEKQIPKAAPLSRFREDSRPRDAVVCFSGSYGGGNFRTWADFLAGSAALRKRISAEKAERWILHCNDYWYFLLAFTALLQCGKQALLTANIAPLYIAEIAGGRDDIALLTDHAEAAGLCGAKALLEKSFYVPAVAVPDNGAEITGGALPPLDAGETVIVMYTSGTTGRPKAVYQRLTEFEADNAFILSKWGEEFLSRKVCSSVSPHHIYGLLFSVMLPFTAGVPFRRERIEYPETLEELRDVSYLFVTVPAFLKRCVEGMDEDGAGNTRSLGLNSPWIFTSGGAVLPDVAKKTEAALGFWPLEVYGSTETSGIAWRQSKSGPEWTPFDNAKIWLNGEGCLVIQSPYIKDPEGFTTGDLAEIFDDGRFLLKGRADSIVKIEEKRISLPEVEARLLRSDLVSDAAVIAIQGKRQYLAAALALNAAGASRFAGTEKRRVNQWFREYLGQFFEPMVIPKRWRYLQALPRNPQGKIQNEAIRALFTDEKPERGSGDA